MRVSKNVYNVVDASIDRIADTPVNLLLDTYFFAYHY